MDNLTYFDGKTKKEMGSHIKEARKKRGMTQSNLAETLDLSIDQMSNIENGKNACKIKYLFIIHQVLQVSFDYLFIGETESKKVEYDSITKEIADKVSPMDDLDKNQISEIVDTFRRKKQNYPERNSG